MDDDNCIVNVPGTDTWREIINRWRRDVAIIETAARHLCHEDGKIRTMLNPNVPPCGHYATWKEYEDANWRRFVPWFLADAEEHARKVKP